MTESEWLTCAGTERALLWLRKRASNRKLRLFACACCRQIDDLLAQETSRKALSSVEEYAEGRVSRDDLRTTRKAVTPASIDFSDMAGHCARIAVVRAAHEQAWQAARRASSVASEAVTYRPPTQRPPGLAVGSISQHQLALLRDIFNPLRPISINPALLTPTVTHLAATAYDERALPSGHLDPDRLAVLSDALEEAGCDDATILEHLRSPGPHVRGCWAVDLVLGRS